MQNALFVVFLVVVLPLINVLHTSGRQGIDRQGIDQAGQFVRGRTNGRGLVHAPAQVAVVGTECRLAVAQRDGHHPQRLRQSVSGALACARDPGSRA